MNNGFHGVSIPQGVRHKWYTIIMKTITTYILLAIFAISFGLPVQSSASMMRMMPTESFCKLPNKTLKRGSSQKDSESLRNILAFYKEYRTNNFGETYIETMDYEIGFGRKLRNDVKLFQKLNKLSQDGVVGPKTRKKILVFCNTHYEKGTSKTVIDSKEFTVVPNQKFSLAHYEGTEFFVTEIYNNSCEVNWKTDPNVNCIALVDPVVGINAILGGDATLGEIIIAPGTSRELGANRITVVSINETANPRSVTLRVERTEK